MKSLALLLFTCVATPLSLVAADAGVGASPAVTDDVLNLLRVDLRATKAEIVANSLELTADELAKFWPIYAEYDLELVKLNTDRIAVLREFSSSYASIDDVRAEEMTHRSFEFQKRRLALLEKYYAKAAKVFNPATAARFVQVEYQMLQLVDVQIASELPLIPRTALIQRVVTK